MRSQNRYVAYRPSSTLGQVLEWLQAGFTVGEVAEGLGVPPDRVFVVGWLFGILGKEA